MKLQHLAVGTRFVYEGKIFVKTGPITATSDQGDQRVIPRSAILKTLDHVSAGTTLSEKIDKATVLAAFNSFYQDYSKILDSSEQEKLEAARQEFLSAINN